jgi:hypothetical protein
MARRLLAVELPQEVLERQAQGWNLDQSPVADEITVDPEVVMDEHVAHPGDLSPGDARRSCSERGGHTLGGLSQNLEVAHDGVEGLLVRA